MWYVLASVSSGRLALQLFNDWGKAFSNRIDKNTEI